MDHNSTQKPAEGVLLQEIQVLLAEKRTFFALLRTSIAVITLPLSIIVFLLSTAKYHGLFENYWIAAVLLCTLTIVSLSGLNLLSHSLRKIKKTNHLINGIKQSNKRVSEIVI